METRQSAIAILFTITAALLTPVSTASVLAAESSDWVNDTASAVRLIAAKPRAIDGVATVRSGIEIKLQPGWKVYGRDPVNLKRAESKWDIDPNYKYKYVGVPPQIDFSGSANIRRISVLWPEPTRFTEGDYYSLGYLNNVVLPLHIVPNEQKKPVKLKLKLDYAICAVICVPAKANVALELTKKDGATFDRAVSAAEARVK